MHRDAQHRGGKAKSFLSVNYFFSELEILNEDVRTPNFGISVSPEFVERPRQ